MKRAELETFEEKLQSWSCVMQQDLQYGRGLCWCSRILLYSLLMCSLLASYLLLVHTDAADQWAAAAG
jgi:cytochrome c oxidase assembly factor CtaG